MIRFFQQNNARPSDIPHIPRVSDLFEQLWVPWTQHLVTYRFTGMRLSLWVSLCKMSLPERQRFSDINRIFYVCHSNIGLLATCRHSQDGGSWGSYYAHPVLCWVSCGGWKLHCNVVSQVWVHPAGSWLCFLMRNLNAIHVLPRGWHAMFPTT